MYKKIIFLLVMLIVCMVMYPAFYINNLQASDGITMINRFDDEGFEVTGTIESNEFVELTLNYPVYIDNVYVENNNYVNKGQLIFTLDKDKMTKLAAKNYEDNNMPQQDNMEQVIAAQVAQGMISDIPREIYATESGIISGMNIEKGSIVLAGNRICSISKTDKTILKISLSQEDYKRANVGDKLKIYPIISQDREYDAIITDRCAVIKKSATPFGSKTVIEIFAQIEDPDQFIIQGLQFSGKILKDNEKTIKGIPYEYIKQDTTGEYLYIYINSRVEKVYIKTGKEFSDMVEIITPFEKDTIFLKNDKLKKGSVVIKNEFK